ncbi:gluconate permease [Gilliamella apicola]|uniref:Gluconate permease n=2 Tax=Gilliamella apicola TaxID=1196095 RepID=A0A2V4DZK8_9GAMM|nr:SLC13 family permease [Gilliamella apicola]PXZ06350.1 gluconate permease [Gilliamella apicola]
MSKKENKKSLYPYVLFNGVILVVVGLIVFYLGSLHSIEKSSWRMVAGLLVAITLLLFMILKTRIQAFPALIISALITGSLGGMPGEFMIATISKGFGNTLGNIGIVIGFGVMMGSVLQLSGAAQKMAQVFIKLLGKGREALALVIIGLLVSLAVFCDSAFIVLLPLVKAISRSTGKSVVGLGSTLAMGLVISHSMIPPAVGPFGVVSQFGIGLGEYMLWAMLLAIPITFAGFIYTRYVGRSIYQIPTEDGENFTREPLTVTSNNIDEDQHLPSALASFAPIVTPIILILTATLVNEMKWDNTIAIMLKTMGHPIVAVGIGLLISIMALTNSFPRKEVVHHMENSIRSAGIILLVIGGGGALGMVLRDSGTGQIIAEYIVKIGVPGILLPLTISTLIRLIQGSGVVAMITAASITAPMIGTLGVNPIMAGLGCSIGSFMFSHFNDAYFWVVNRSLGVTEVKEQIKVWSITSTVLWAAGTVSLLIVNAIFF